MPISERIMYWMHEAERSPDEGRGLRGLSAEMLTHMHVSATAVLACEREHGIAPTARPPIGPSEEPSSAELRIARGRLLEAEARAETLAVNRALLAKLAQRPQPRVTHEPGGQPVAVEPGAVARVFLAGSRGAYGVAQLDAAGRVLCAHKVTRYEPGTRGPVAVVGPCAALHSYDGSEVDLSRDSVLPLGRDLAERLFGVAAS